MPQLLNEDIRAQVRDLFDQQLKESVQVLFFGEEKDCQTCSDTQQLIEEISELSDKIKVQVYDIDRDAEIAHIYHVDKAPGLVLTVPDGEKVIDYGIRFAGIPSGHEFSTLIHDLILVSGRDSGLNQPTRDFLAGLSKPVFLQVFVTPT